MAYKTFKKLRRATVFPPDGPPMWTLAEGIKTICLLEPLAKGCSCHVGLTGGVLFNGSSHKDLDIIVYPHRQGEWNSYFEDKLKDFFSAGQLTTCDGEGDSATQDRDGKTVKWLVTPKGKRIDFFFMQ